MNSKDKISKAQILPARISNIRRLQGLSRIFPSLIASLTVVALMELNAWLPLERAVNNQMMLWRGATEWDSRIVMISIDNKTLDAYGGQFPISREYYADLLQRLTQEDVSVVAFNILFVDTAAASRLPESSAINAELASAMATLGKVVIAQAWDDDDKALLPVPVLADTAIAVGHLQFETDPDGIIRRVPILWQGIPTLGVAAIQAYSLQTELVGIPTDRRDLRINWPASARALPTLSLADVLNGNYPSGYFKDKIVIVSYGATAGQVQMRTPFDYEDPVPGGYLHAAVVDTLLKQNWLQPVSANAMIVLLLIGGSFFGALLYRRGVAMQLAIGGSACVGWLIACMLALYWGYLLPVVPPLATFLLVGAVATILSRLQANALLQVRSAFLNTMSHEIRTPLNAIVNFSAMLQETQLDDRQREFAETLNTSSQALLALINDVLDFSKIESGRLAIESYPVKLSDIVERSLEMLAPRALEKDLELVYSITPATPSVVMSDPVRLQQILLNLLSNAVKFTEMGEISVQVQATARVQNKSLFALRSLRPNRWRRRQQLSDHVKSKSQSKFQSKSQPKSAAQYQLGDLYEIRFAVHDTGIGIPPERISQIFKPFSQVSASTTRKYGGTGLGLSISKRLSERMGGDLWVKSYPGEGSTFYFTMQAHVAEVTQAKPSYWSALSGTRLLLVDRNITRRNHFTWELEPLGIRLAQATSLSEAMTFMQNDPTFDGIVLDEAVASSLEECAIALQTLRQTARNEHLPVILLSSLQADAQSPLATSRLSGITVIWKPVKQVALYQALRSIQPVTVSLLSTVPPEQPSEQPSEHLSEHLSEEASLTDLSHLDPTSDRASEVANRRASLSILIAEDNRINQRVALRLLELLGYHADVASSGLEVLTALKRQRYDVILMDMRMPELDGIETTRQIRQMPQHAQTWIIAMTANAMARDRQRCFAAGMNDYLSKPVHRAALDQALQRCPQSRTV